MLKFFNSFFNKVGKNSRTVLFYRNFQGFQGGHLKTWNYFKHVESMERFKPEIYFTDSSKWRDNPWKGACSPEKNWDPNSADILFLAGLDWSSLANISVDAEKPIINLIQHVRHADPQDIRYQYLKKRAIRICVSDEVASALLSTGCVNGPIFTIRNGIDIDETSKISSEKKSRKVDVLISGLKNKDLALRLNLELKKLGLKVECQVESVSRESYLRKLSSSKVSLMLPSRTEGFYLPALESMAVGSLVICPDCIGNKGFCNDNKNCYMPLYDFDSLISATLDAMNLDVISYQSFINNGYQTANEHSLLKERSQFWEIMSKIDMIWQENG